MKVRVTEESSNNLPNGLVSMVVKTGVGRDKEKMDLTNSYKREEGIYHEAI